MLYWAITGLLLTPKLKGLTPEREFGAPGVHRNVELWGEGFERNSKDDVGMARESERKDTARTHTWLWDNLRLWVAPESSLSETKLSVDRDDDGEGRCIFGIGKKGAWCRLVVEGYRHQVQSRGRSIR